MFLLILLRAVGVKASQIGETIILRLKDVETEIKGSIESVNQGERGKANQLTTAFNDARTGLFGELDTSYCA